MREIRLGLENNVDVLFYADIKYTWQQMEQMRLGLEDFVNVTYYADYTLSASQMETIREYLNKKTTADIKAVIDDTI